MKERKSSIRFKGSWKNIAEENKAGTRKAKKNGKVFQIKISPSYLILFSFC